MKVVEFNGNFGQHMAILAAFEKSSGDIVITLDADLQNPPEEIPKLVAEVEKGHDVVGTIRQKRQDTFFRKAASRIVNITTNKMTGMRMSDYGCMLRAYHRHVIDNINRCQETTTFIPALAQTFAANPSEVDVAHAERAEGESKYSLYKLIRLNFDLMTGFSVVPLQLFALLGIIHLPVRRRLRPLSSRPALHRRRRSGRGLHPVRHPLLLHRHHHLRHRHRRGVRGEDLPGSAKKAAICCQKDVRVR